MMPLDVCVKAGECVMAMSSGGAETPDIKKKLEKPSQTRKSCVFLYENFPNGFPCRLYGS
jgi:hypothetical protein